MTKFPLKMIKLSQNTKIIKSILKHKKNVKYFLNKRKIIILLRTLFRCTTPYFFIKNLAEIYTLGKLTLFLSVFFSMSSINTKYLIIFPQ